MEREDPQSHTISVEFYIKRFQNTNKTPRIFILTEIHAKKTDFLGFV
jgi:hypothetical protein